jgi:hypothetical protein
MGVQARIAGQHLKDASSRRVFAEDRFDVFAQQVTPTPQRTHTPPGFCLGARPLQNLQA